MSTIHEMDTTYLKTLFNSNTHVTGTMSSPPPFFSGMRVITSDGVPDGQAMLIGDNVIAFQHNVPPPQYGSGINITYDWSADAGARSVIVAVEERKPTLREVWLD